MKELFALSQDTDAERLSKEFLALPKISKTVIFQFEFSGLFDPVMKKIVGPVKQANVDFTMF